MADIKPIYKKISRNEKSNYRPVSVLPNLSKVYERILFEQISSFFENILSRHQCGFRKGFSAQHCLLRMIEKWRNCLDHGKVTGALLTDLSKAFDCLTHELLIAKLNAYGFDINATRLIYSYLTGRKQRVKINQAYSSWKDIIYGVPQGSILGPLLFNIYLCDLFLFTEDLDIANYADDTTPYHCSDNTESVIEMLEIAATKLFQWFKDNNLKANADKCHLLLSTNESEQININDTIIDSSKAEKLLGILIDNKKLIALRFPRICLVYAPKNCFPLHATLPPS